MKKTYSNPTIKVVKIQPLQKLMVLSDTLHNSVNAGDSYARDFDFDFDDEEE